MKYSERDALVADLREFADLIEKVGHKLPIEIYYPFTLSNFIYGDEGTSKAKMVKAAKNLGSCEKDYRSDYFSLKKLMSNGHVGIKFETARKNVCTPKVVGTEKVEKSVFVKTGVFEDKDIIEWECNDSLLAS